jgi:hypothetical protein
LFFLQAHQFLGTTHERSRAHLGDYLTDISELAPQINARLGPGQTFFIWADEPELYALTQRRPPTVMLWKMHAEQGPMSIWLTSRTLADLQTNPPPLVLVWTFGGDPPANSHPIYRWILDHYTPREQIGRGLFRIMTLTPYTQHPNAP